MPESGTVFISSDYILDRWLRQIGGELAKRGFDIVVGPKQQPPAKVVFAQHDWPRFFSQADLIVMTTRSIVSREILAQAPRLRGVVFPTIGTESIDLAAANDLGIIVAHGPTPENFNSMAEATVLLMLALMYDLHETERVLRENRPRPDVMRARMLMGKTVGIIGLGRIARGVVDRLAGWGVRILAYDPNVAPDATPSLVERADLETVLRESDIVTVHTTLTSGTRGMIGAAELALMKPSAFIINTARGGIIDERALRDALGERRIAGAALDAFELEPLPADSELRNLDNVILTPHMIGHTREIFDAIPGAALANIERIMHGELPLYCRNPEAATAWQRRLTRLAAAAS
jgi:phosphoglycerate dehydrogenase-like enzyme